MQKGIFSRKQIATGLLISTIGSIAWADHPGVGFGASSSGPITTISASTLPAGAKSVGLEVTRVRAKPFSDEELAGYAGRHIHAHSADSLTSTSIGLGYGVTNDFTIGLRLPYIHRDNVRAGHHSHTGDVATNAVEAHGDSRGIGDSSVIGKYRFLNDSISNQEAALLVGLEVPTGTTNRRNLQGARFETEHQPGSGSWDPLVGLAYTKRIGKMSFDTSVLYKIATRGAQAADLGDQFFYNAAVSYRLKDAVGEQAEPHHHHDHSREQKHHHHSEVTEPFGSMNVDLVLELNGEWQEKQKLAGVVDNNSGGNALYLSPGLRLSSTSNWTANLSLGIPIAQNLNGAHPESDWRMTVGVSRRF
jgi:hypothetical protein